MHFWSSPTAEANRILPPPAAEGRRRSSSSALRPRRLPPLPLPTSREEGAPWTPRLAVLHRRGLQRDDGGQAPSQEEEREARRAHPQHLERGATVRARDGGDEGQRGEVEHAAHGVDRRSEAGPDGLQLPRGGPSAGHAPREGAEVGGGGRGRGVGDRGAGRGGAPRARGRRSGCGGRPAAALSSTRSSERSESALRARRS